MTRRVLLVTGLVVALVILWLMLPVTSNGPGATANIEADALRDCGFVVIAYYDATGEAITSEDRQSLLRRIKDRADSLSIDASLLSGCSSSQVSFVTNPKVIGKKFAELIQSDFVILNASPKPGRAVGVTAGGYVVRAPRS